MIEEYRELLKCLRPLVFCPYMRYYVVKHKIGNRIACLCSEPIGAGYDIYWVKVNKGLELALGYGVECLYGDKLNDLCLKECE